jgi:hypothetical protein
MTSNRDLYRFEFMSVWGGYHIRWSGGLGNACARIGTKTSLLSQLEIVFRLYYAEVKFARFFRLRSVNFDAL